MRKRVRTLNHEISFQFGKRETTNDLPNVERRSSMKQVNEDWDSGTVCDDELSLLFQISRRTRLALRKAALPYGPLRVEVYGQPSSTGIRFNTCIREYRGHNHTLAAFALLLFAHGPQGFPCAQLSTLKFSEVTLLCLYFVTEKNLRLDGMTMTYVWYE